MPAPPTEIHIKRKATDDPVDLLQLQNEVNGIRPIREYVFKRQRTSATPYNQSVEESPSKSLDPPQVAVSFSGIKKLPGIAGSQTIGEGQHTQGQTLRALAGNRDTAEGRRGSSFSIGFTKLSAAHEVAAASSKGLAESSSTEPRRFHLSRPPGSQYSTGPLSCRTGGTSGAPAIFIERKWPARPAKPAELPAKRSDTDINDTVSENPVLREIVEGTPSKLTRTKVGIKSSLEVVPLDSEKIQPWNNDESTIAAAIQTYTMQTIGKNLAESSQSTPQASATSATSNSKTKQVSSYKPKPQSSRYHERHAKQRASAKQNQDLKQDEAMIDAMETDDDSGYVMDTYVRMPAEILEFEEKNSIGLLVLDSQPDIDEFYKDDSDSDSITYDEEDDENAENHPSNDYPDEELESDDQYGRNPYRHYLNGHASDNEDFDLTYSDDEDPKTSRVRRPWMR